MKISPDGLIHLSVKELLDIPLVHFFSSVDYGITTPIQQCGTVVPISGYTEWINASQPTISIGWDWFLEVSHHGIQWTRFGPPRTNLALLNEHAMAFDWTSNLVELAAVVDRLPWQDQVAQALKT
jgi:hypothetical protein